MTSLYEFTVEAGGLRFAALEAGKAGDPLVLCLHGFPDSAWTWRYLLPALADAGFHAVAPFMRGYSPTELPAQGFGIADLAGDVLALEEALRGAGRSALVGHDWGAAALYGALRRDAGRWSCAIAAAVPPSGGYSIDVISLAQMRRSWYSYLFQLPDIAIPERLAADDDLALVDSLWADWSPGYDAAEDIPHAKDALRPPGHLRAAISYYRDASSDVPTPERAAEVQDWFGRLTVPLLYLHGARDGCIGIDSVERVRPWFPRGAEVAVLERAGHFVQLEEPEEVNRLVLDFVARASTT
jgi:pimeloyl-ACP methyl ester carboxylesterase